MGSKFEGRFGGRGKGMRGGQGHRDEGSVED